MQTLLNLSSAGAPSACPLVLARWEAPGHHLPRNRPLAHPPLPRRGSRRQSPSRCHRYGLLCMAVHLPLLLPLSLAGLLPLVQHQLSQAVGVLFWLEPPRCHLPRLDPRRCSKSWTAALGFLKNFRVSFSFVVWACFDVTVGPPGASAAVGRVVFGIGSREMSSRVGLSRFRGTGASRSFSTSSIWVSVFIFSSDCSISQCLLSAAPPAGVAGAGPAAVSCAAAGSGGLVGVKNSLLGVRATLLAHLPALSTSLDVLWLPTNAAGRLPCSARACGLIWRLRLLVLSK